MTATRKPLDVRTLRAVARRLRMRANGLDRKAKRQFKLTGRPGSDVSVGRACEADMQADILLIDARAIARKAKKGAKK